MEIFTHENLLLQMEFYAPATTLIFLFMIQNRVTSMRVCVSV